MVDQRKITGIEMVEESVMTNEPVTSDELRIEGDTGSVKRTRQKRMHKRRALLLIGELSAKNFCVRWKRERNEVEDKDH